MKKYLIFLTIFLLASVAAYPQRGRGAGGGRSQQDNQNPQGGMQGGMQSGNGETDRQQTRIDSRQREQIKECSSSADNVRKQARDMAKNSEKQFKAGETRENFSRMQEQIKTMEQQHTRLMQGMGPEQQEAFKGQIQNMNQLQSRLENQVRQMNETLGEANPDGARVSTRAREIEKTMNEYKQQYNTLASQSD